MQCKIHLEGIFYVNIYTVYIYYGTDNSFLGISRKYSLSFSNDFFCVSYTVYVSGDGLSVSVDVCRRFSLSLHSHAVCLTGEISVSNPGLFHLFWIFLSVYHLWLWWM